MSAPLTKRKRAAALEGAAHILAELKLIDPDLRLDAFAFAIAAWLEHPGVITKETP